jgi:hypothetical protein
MFWYYVTPIADEKWNVLFDNQQGPNIFESRDEAIKAAVDAALESNSKKGVAAGVRFKNNDDDNWRVAISCGE